MRPGFCALPRSKLLRFRFSGTPQRHRLGWACVLCLSQVRGAQVTSWPAHCPRWSVCLIISLGPATRFPGCAAGAPPQVCRVSPLGADIFSSSWFCCHLKFQNSPQTHWCEGFLVFGNVSSFTTPPPWDGSPPLTLLSLFLSLIFCPTSFRREWAAFLGAWCPPPAFRSCFVEFAHHSNDLLMNLWGRKWSPRPIPPPS